jgi:aspartokinase/homoserine dehydrogenase 1
MDLIKLSSSQISNTVRDEKQINLFVTGVGNVGEKLLKQILKQKKILKNKLNLSIRIIGISNSTKMVFNKNGINLEFWKNKLKNGVKANELLFKETAKKLNLINSVFVDNTASEEISNLYNDYLSQSISVVTCNKIACSNKLSNYQNLIKLSIRHNCSFLYETNVGAGLPIIDTLKNLINSGDKIISIQAVLSGSLNYIFNNYNNSNTFKKVVIKAMEEGYTEPNPKIDLSGIDVARKILILIRESGKEIEISEIINNSFVPKKCLDTNSNKDFLTSLSENENHFKKLLNKAIKTKSKIKYVAEYKNEKATIGIKYIPENHDFYNIEGSDNVVLFYTNRYQKQPLIVKGAGAGSEVTAAGIFADILRVRRN